MIFEKYNKTGFDIKKNFMSKKNYNLIFNTFKITLKKYLNKDVNYNNFNDQNLHKNLIDFRLEDPKKFGKFYDELKLNTIIRSFFFEKKMLKLISKYLNTNYMQIYASGFMLRLDVPHDKRNRLDWHQDGNYYTQTAPNFNALVCWVPLVDVNLNNGTLQFIEDTHQFLYNSKIKKKKIIQ